MRMNRVLCVLIAGTVCSAAAGQTQEPALQPAVRTFNHEGAVPAGGGGGGGGSTQRNFPLRLVDVTNITSVTTVNNPANTMFELYFAPGTKVWGYSADAMFNYHGGPANATAGFRLWNSSNEFIDATFTPDVMMNYHVDIMAFKVAPNSEIELTDGRLRIEFFEAFEDVAGTDGTWTSGTIGVMFEDSGECCLWDNGPYDMRTSVPSQNACDRLPANGQQPCTFAADDFYLEPNYIHRIDWFEVTFIVENPETYVPGSTIGTTFIYKDCNGAPGELVPGYEAGFPLLLPHDALVETLLDGSEVYRLIALTDKLFLDGGKAYWVSFQPTGATGQGGTDVWFWGSSGSPDGLAPPPYVKGSPAMKMAGPGEPWEIICRNPAAACAGCTDLNFCMRGERCKFIYDAGDYRTWTLPGPAPAITALGARSIDASGLDAIQARAADDVTISPCETDLFPCLIEAYIWTNCWTVSVPPNARLEVYATECGMSPANFARPQDAVLVASLSTSGGEDAVYQGWELPSPGASPFRLYCFRFTEFGPFVFEAGKTYWISAVGTGGANITNDAYFAFREPRCPEDECYRTGNPGFARSDFTGMIYPWTSTGDLPIVGALEEDFAIRVAVRNGPSMFTGGATPSCIADFDRSGQVAVADIFSFLSEWFSGCP